jgi:hypothetical protein
MEILTQRAERTLGWIVIALVIGSLMAMLGVAAGCAGPRTLQAQAELQAMQDEALKDGNVSNDEKKAIDEKREEIGRVNAEEQSQWPELVATSLTTLIVGLLGVRAWRGPSTKGQP